MYSEVGKGPVPLTPTNSVNVAPTSITREQKWHRNSADEASPSVDLPHSSPHPAYKPQFSWSRWASPFLLQTVVLCCLGLVALIPRIILANQLDLVTDEIIYILAGKSYMPLLTHITTSIGTEGWQLNYEHPPFVKFLIGLSILGNKHIGYPFNELMAARIPSIIAGTALIMAIYWLGRKPFGYIVAFFTALSLALSPWLVYFSSIAYLDMTMTMFITIAYLLTWHAIRRPWLYLCIALFVGLGIDSKYTATLIIPGILLFTAYYFFVLRLYLPASHRPAIPWRWWLIAGILTPFCFFVLDPVIWSNPLPLFVHSILYEWNHSMGGHLTFLAGRANLHVPYWTVLYIIINKISATATVPAAIFAIIAPIQLIRFHLQTRTGNAGNCREGAGTPAKYRFFGKRRGVGLSPPFSHTDPHIEAGQGRPPPHAPTEYVFPQIPTSERAGVPSAPIAPSLAPITPSPTPIAPLPAPIPPFPTPTDLLLFRVKEAATIAFLLIWLLASLAMFSLLNIVVGTHYLLPLAPPVVIAGAYTLVSLVRYSIRKIGRGRAFSSTPSTGGAQTSSLHSGDRQRKTEGRKTPPYGPLLHIGRGLAPFRVPSWLTRKSDGSPLCSHRSQLSFQSVSIIVIIGLILVSPHLLGLLNTTEAEGYTSEFFHGENTTLQVAYPGYREAVQWLEAHTQGEKRIGLVAFPQTLLRDNPHVSWFAYNSNLSKRFQIQEAHPNDSPYPYDYLVWPMHLVQRGYLLPPLWTTHIIHVITGGDTIYCYIAAAAPP